MKDVPRGKEKGVNVSVTVQVQVAGGVQAHRRSVSLTTVVSDAVTMVAVTTVVVTTAGAMIVAATTAVNNGVNVKGMEVGNADGKTKMTAGNADAGMCETLLR